VSNAIGPLSGGAAKISRKIEIDGQRPKNCVTIEGFAAHISTFARNADQAVKRFLKRSNDRKNFQNLDAVLKTVS
jgi:hypothetical protein